MILAELGYYSEHIAHCWFRSYVYCVLVFLFGLNSLTENAENPRGIECSTGRPNSVYSPALLIRKSNDNPPIEVNLYVYSID
ncbi:hypothetical protein HRED_09162 [Candidatus Haloredivivus sp. G17]|nr:hypothetical protein HRED_09162 [Candidatus Haloredivivus sp. G17]